MHSTLPHFIPLAFTGLCTTSWRNAGESQPGPREYLVPRTISQTFPPLPSLWLGRWGWYCPPDSFPCRRAQLKRCLEQLRQQMPLGVDCTRYTTLSLLRRARMHIQVRSCLLSLCFGDSVVLWCGCPGCRAASILCDNQVLLVPESI